MRNPPRITVKYGMPIVEAPSDMLREFRWYFGGIGVLLVVIFFYPAAERLTFLKVGQTTTGTVIDFELPTDHKMSQFTLVKFEFEDTQGVTHQVLTEIPGRWIPAGDYSCQVRYHPDYPTAAEIVTASAFWWYWPMYLLVFGAGLFLLILGWEVLIRLRGSPSPREEDAYWPHPADVGEKHVTAWNQPEEKK